MTWPLFLGCLKVPLPRYRAPAAVAGLALRLQQSLEAAAIAYSAGLGTLQTPAWRPQPPSADTATFAMAGLPWCCPHVSGVPACPLPVPGCSGGRGARVSDPSRRLCKGPVLSCHLALWVSLSCPVKIGGDSCAFPTQDLSQLMSAKAADLPLLLLKLLSRLHDVHFDKSCGLVHGSRTAAGRGTVGSLWPGAAVPMPPCSIPVVIWWPCFY